MGDVTEEDLERFEALARTSVTFDVDDGPKLLALVAEVRRSRNDPVQAAIDCGRIDGTDHVKVAAWREALAAEPSTMQPIGVRAGVTLAHSAPDSSKRAVRQAAERDLRSIPRCPTCGAGASLRVNEVAAGGDAYNECVHGHRWAL